MINELSEYDKGVLDYTLRLTPYVGIILNKAALQGKTDDLFPYVAVQ